MLLSQAVPQRVTVNSQYYRASINFQIQEVAERKYSPPVWEKVTDSVTLL